MVESLGLVRNFTRQLDTIADSRTTSLTKRITQLSQVILLLEESGIN